MLNQLYILNVSSVYLILSTLINTFYNSCIKLKWHSDRQNQTQHNVFCPIKNISFSVFRLFNGKRSAEIG